MGWIFQGSVELTTYVRCDFLCRAIYSRPGFRLCFSLQEFQLVLGKVKDGKAPGLSGVPYKLKKKNS